MNGLGIAQGTSRLKDALPCPFCGSSRILIGMKWSAICVDCGATGPDKDKESKAGQAWNKRSQHETQQSQIP